MHCRFIISYDNFLKEHIPRTQGSCLERDCLGHHGEMLLTEIADVISLMFCQEELKW